MVFLLFLLPFLHLPLLLSQPPTSSTLIPVSPYQPLPSLTFPSIPFPSFYSFLLRSSSPFSYFFPLTLPSPLPPPPRRQAGDRGRQQETRPINSAPRILVFGDPGVAASSRDVCGKPCRSRPLEELPRHAFLLRSFRVLLLSSILSLLRFRFLCFLPLCFHCSSVFFFHFPHYSDYSFSLSSYPFPTKKVNEECKRGKKETNKTQFQAQMSITAKALPSPPPAPMPSYCLQ